MLKIGIECESIEGKQWGVGRIVSKLLEDISLRPDLATEFKFYLYFKSRIPDLPCLENPIFVKTLVGQLVEPVLPGGAAAVPFSLYYYLLLPLRLRSDGLDATYFPNYMLPMLFSGKSVVDLTEDVHHEAHYGSNPFLWRLGFRVFCRWAAKHGTKLETFTESSRRELARLYEIPLEKIAVNYHGVNVSLAGNGHGAGRNGREPYILYFGQAFPRRHLKETMLAFEIVARRLPALRLIAVGHDRYNPPVIKKLQEAINERLGREAIVYKEYVPEAERDALFSGAQALVYISTKEAFGLPPLEALGYGTVPIVARTATTEELLADKAFFVNDPESVESIADCMVEALTNHKKRDEIRKSGPEMVGQYSWQAHTDRFLEILRTLCATERERSGAPRLSGQGAKSFHHR